MMIVKMQVAALTVAATSLVAPAAAAAEADLACKGTVKYTFAPPLTALPHNTAITATEAAPLKCRSSSSDVATATMNFKGEGYISCLGGSFTGGTTLTFDTGTTSKYTNSGAINALGLNSTGRVVKGEFDKAQVTVTDVLPLSLLSCYYTGIVGVAETAAITSIVAST